MSKCKSDIYCVNYEGFIVLYTPDLDSGTSSFSLSELQSLRSAAFHQVGFRSLLSVEKFEKRNQCPSRAMTNIIRDRRSKAVKKR